MKVVFKLHASLMELLPPGTRGHAIELDVDENTCVADVLGRYHLTPARAAIVLVNGHFIPPAVRAATRLAEGDHLAVWPPIAGG